MFYATCPRIQKEDGYLKERKRLHHKGHMICKKPLAQLQLLKNPKRNQTHLSKAKTTDSTNLLQQVISSSPTFLL